MSLPKPLVVTAIVLASVILLIVLLMCFNLVATRIATKKYNMVSLEGKVEKTTTTTQPEKAIAHLYDVDMCYYVLGEGYPLILVHGNGGNHTGLLELATYLANDYQVFLVESRCHGESSWTEQISYDLMAKDLQQFILLLNLHKPIIIGHSDGGINAIVTAINYPDLLGGIVSFGANTKPSQFKWYFTMLVKVNDFAQKSILNEMMLTEPNITTEQLQGIPIPTFIVAGEYDIVKLKDTLHMANSIPNAQYAIVKGADHSNYVHDGARCYELVAKFLQEITP